MISMGGCVDFDMHRGSGVGKIEGSIPSPRKRMGSNGKINSSPR